jgi:uncharacterized protein (DUF362 family)
MKVYMTSPKNRLSGVQTLLQQFDLEKFCNKTVVVKANFNSADPFPASTHPDTLRAIFSELKKRDARIIVAERSGMSDTKKVLTNLGIYDLVSEFKGEIIVLNSLKKDQYSRISGEHWQRGFLLAQVFLDADHVISTCCLKTHRFGGHFTLSLKNSVGAIARYDPYDRYDYMQELHQSPHQRTMIAEINAALPCSLVILDAVKGFSTLGPDQGNIIEPNLLLASTDRVAIDAVGVSLLRYYGTTPEVEKGSIFEQEQIKRAVELGIGIKSADEIEVIPLDETAREFIEKLEI